MTVETTAERRALDDYLAVGIAEGFEEAIDEAETIAAWQHIYDRGLHRTLQGWFGRCVQHLINCGVIVEKTDA